MNCVERVHAALRLEQPDRVPIVEFLIDPKVAAAAVPGCRDGADCMDRLGMDAVACGAGFRRTAETARAGGMAARAVRHAGGCAEVVEFLKGILQDGDVLLVKGSRSLRMETIVEYLKTTG